MLSKLSRRRVVVLLVLTSLLLITLDRRGSSPVIDKARQGFAVVLRPFDIAAQAISKPIANAWYGISNYDDLKAENAALRDQIEHQKGTDIESRTAINTANELIKLNRLTSARGYKSVVARVEGDAPSNFQNTVEITVGSLDGVRAGMPVTDSAGLIGKVLKVYPDKSLVRLISDPQYFVEAQVSTRTDGVDPSVTSSTVATDGSGPGSVAPSESTGSTTPDTTPPTSTTTPPKATTTTGSSKSGTTTSTTSTTIATFDVRRETGNITGQSVDQPLLFSLIEDNASTSVQVGGIVVTSGGRKSLAPQGIPIGTITSVTQGSGSRSPIVEVRPNATLTQLNFVSVVLYVPNQAAI
jgi:cell shape-determining protein MreC